MLRTEQSVVGRDQWLLLKTHTDHTDMSEHEDGRESASVMNDLSYLFFRLWVTTALNQNVCVI